jgi:replicative superfamily II helicase
VDPKAWYRLFAHLASHAQLSTVLKGYVSQEDGQVHLILDNAHEQVNSTQLKQVVKALLSDPDTAAHLRKLLEDADGAGSSPYVVAIIVHALVSEGQSEYQDEPRTLRESIDREWPW